MSGDRIGFTAITADGPVNTSGAAVAVYTITINSGAVAAGQIALYDGTSTIGTLLLKLSGLQDDGFTVALNKGHVFSNGCYVDIDSNTTSAVIWYEKI